MAKTKKKAAIRQQRIPGSIDVPTEKVLDMAEQYVDTLQHRMATQTDENAFRSKLIELMNEADLKEFELDGHKVTLNHSESDTITVKKVKGDTKGD